MSGIIVKDHGVFVLALVTIKFELVDIGRVIAALSGGRPRCCSPLSLVSLTEGPQNT